MRLFNTLFPGKQRSPTPTTASENTSIRYKWQPRRKRTRISKQSSDDQYVGLHRITPFSSSSQAGQETCCPICACDVDALYRLPRCGHEGCISCWRMFSASQVSSFAMAHITCLACDERLPRTLVLSLLRTAIDSSPDTYPSFSNSVDAERLYRRYEDFLLYQCLSKNKHTRWCPNECGYAFFAHGFRACPRLECENPDCNRAPFCYRCRGPWNPTSDTLNGQTSSNVELEHVCARNASRFGADNEGNRPMFSWVRNLFRMPNLAPTEGAPIVAGHTPVRADSNSSRLIASAQNDLMRTLSQRTNVPSSEAVPIKQASHLDSSPISLASEARKPSGDMDISNVELNLPGNATGQVKPCPQCKTLLLKLDDGSCNHMSCLLCGCEFCWLCLRKVRGTHYLSPSGCTFWGRQRWTLRRRICVMLLAAFGTPFVFAFFLAIAIPGIIFGFPIYFALYANKYSSSASRCKKIVKGCLGFFGGLLLSPLLAALAVLLGVPLVLIYVYIFMPISLFTGKRLAAKTSDPVDPNIGWSVDWSRVAEAHASVHGDEEAPTTDGRQKHNHETLESSPEISRASTPLFTPPTDLERVS